MHDSGWPAGVKPDASDYDKRTALMVAAHEGHDSGIHLLLDEGADPNAQDTFGSTAL
jgi:glutaminase